MRRRTGLGRRSGEAGFTVLEATLALAATLLVALSAVEAFRATQSAYAAAAAREAARAAAEAALARVGADLPAAPGVWEIAADGLKLRVVLAPFDARAEPAGPVEVGRLEALEIRRRRAVRGQALHATAIAAARPRDGGAPVIARLETLVIGVAQALPDDLP